MQVETHTCNEIGLSVEIVYTPGISDSTVFKLARPGQGSRFNMRRIRCSDVGMCDQQVIPHSLSSRRLRRTLRLRIEFGLGSTIQGSGPHKSA